MQKRSMVALMWEDRPIFDALLIRLMHIRGNVCSQTEFLHWLLYAGETLLNDYDDDKRQIILRFTDFDKGKATEIFPEKEQKDV